MAATTTHRRRSVYLVSAPSPSSTKDRHTGLGSDVGRDTALFLQLCAEAWRRRPQFSWPSKTKKKGKKKVALHSGERIFLQLVCLHVFNPHFTFRRPLRNNKQPLAWRGRRCQRWNSASALMTRAKSRNRGFSPQPTDWLWVKVHSRAEVRRHPREAVTHVTDSDLRATTCPSAGLSDTRLTASVPAVNANQTHTSKAPLPGPGDRKPKARPDARDAASSPPRFKPRFRLSYTFLILFNSPC